MYNSLKIFFHVMSISNFRTERQWMGRIKMPKKTFTFTLRQQMFKCKRSYNWGSKCLNASDHMISLFTLTSYNLTNKVANFRKYFFNHHVVFLMYVSSECKFNLQVISRTHIRHVCHKLRKTHCKLNVIISTNACQFSDTNVLMVWIQLTETVIVYINKLIILR